MVGALSELVAVLGDGQNWTEFHYVGVWPNPWLNHSQDIQITKSDAAASDLVFLALVRGAVVHYYKGVADSQ